MKPGRPKRSHPDNLAPLQFLSPLHKASRQLAIHLQSRMAGHELSPEAAHVLAYLCKFAPCPVGELSRVFGSNKSTLTGVLDRLEHAGFVARTLNPDDRRSFLVTITPAGAREGAAMRKIVDALEKDLAGRITAADLRGFQRVMTAIADVTRIQIRPEGKETQS
jgi:DNA-binding MarR family transcriptional regulator